MRIGLKSGVMIGRATEWKTGVKTSLGPIQRHTPVNGTMMKLPIWCAGSNPNPNQKNNERVKIMIDGGS